MRFRSQLVVGHTALLFTTLLTGLVAVTALYVTTARLQNVTRDLVTDMLAIERLHYQSEALVSSSRGFLLSGGDVSSWSRFDATARNIDQSLAQLRRRSELAADVDQLEVAAHAYVQAERDAAKERSRAEDPVAIGGFFEQTLTPARDRFVDAIRGFVDKEQAGFEKEATDARHLASGIEGIVALATGVSVLLGIVLAWISIRKLNAQYAREREATAVARRAAAARDDLLAIVSHDLRNPLATITMGTCVLDETTDAPVSRTHIAAISAAATRMQHLIDELLDVARLESGTFSLRHEPCEPAALIESTVSLFHARAIDTRIELVALADAVPPVLADRERILQVLSNLVGNALQFTPTGGTITLGAYPVGDRVRFEVRDTGAGIAVEQQAHLFDRYWQGRRGRGGSLGLGLYICKQLVEAHGGQIGVDSRPGDGALFWFTLPRLKAADAEAERPTSIAVERPRPIEAHRPDRAAPDQRQAHGAH